MLHKAEDLRDYQLLTKDGEAGKIDDFSFDDRFWTVRYLVLQTGNWLTPRQVLVSPYAVAKVDEPARRIEVNLTQEQIENSPAPETDPPVSRQFEVEYHDYFGWPYYWYGMSVWGAYPQPLVMPPRVSEEEKNAWDHTLRSTREVRGYQVIAADGGIGHVAGFIVDDQTWTIRYLVIDPRSFWPGKHVLLSPAWVEGIDWQSRTLSVSLDRETIKLAPEYDSDMAITREYETRLHRHYDRDGYWGSDTPLA